MKLGKQKKTPSYIENILKENGIFFYDKFLFPKIEDLYEPSKMKNINEGSQSIINHIKNNSKILIFSHDDGDGITSASVLSIFFNAIDYPVHHYVPNREVDEIGLPLNRIDQFAETGIDLIITVDGCIKCIEAVEYAKDKSIDVVITDHHITGDILPKTICINPKQEECNYPFDLLAGVSVAYKLFLMLSRSWGLEDKPKFSNLHKQAIVYAMLGTITDKVQLINENRLIVQLGLEYISNLNLPFVTILKREVRRLSFDNLSKILGVLNNGREMDGKHLGLDFLITKDFEEAKSVFAKMKSRYTEFKSSVGIWKDRILTNLKNRSIDDELVIYSSNEIPINIHSKLCNEILNHHKKLVILIIPGSDTAKAEARAVAGFDLVEAFKSLENLLIQYGGHKQAAGFTIVNSNIETFTAEFKVAYKEFYTAQSEEIDSSPIRIKSSVISPEFVHYLERIRPFLMRYSTLIFEVDDLHIKERTFLIRNGFSLRDSKDGKYYFCHNKVKH